jgi:uncharacterized protein
MAKFKFYAFKLTGIMILVFIAQVIIPGFTEFFVLNQKALAGEIWRFFTAVFLHGGLGHLAYNSFALLLFGSILEKITSGKRFLAVFYITGILANVFSVNFYSSSLGASGAIFGLIGAIMLIRPLLPIWAFGLPMPIFIAGIFYAIGDIIGAYGFFAGNPIDNTGNLAHISGMFFGLIFGYFFKKKRRRKRRKVILSERAMRHWEDYHFK